MDALIKNLSFYTDGAYSYKTEIGGWSCICVENDEIIQSLKGNEPYSSNNRMELMGFLTALEIININKMYNINAKIYVDSAYISNCINSKWYLTWLKNGWKTADRQNVKNKDLWSKIIALYIKLVNRCQIEVIKVKSHSNNLYNQMADALAVKARKELEK